MDFRLFLREGTRKTDETRRTCFICLYIFLKSAKTIIK